MLCKLLSIIILVAVLVSNSSPQQQGLPKLAYKLKDVEEFGCCGIDLELGLLEEALQTEPGGRAHIIGYSGPVDPQGKLSRYLGYMKANFSDSLGDDSNPVSVVNGGYRQEFTIELWIVPRGAKAPELTPSITTTVIDYRGPVLFDVYGVENLAGEDQADNLNFSSACTLGLPNWASFFRILHDEPTLKGRMIVYVGEEDHASYANKIKKFVKSELREMFPEEAKQIGIAYGGRREWSQVEVWLTPKDGPDQKRFQK